MIKFNFKVNRKFKKSKQEITKVINFFTSMIYETNLTSVCWREKCPRYIVRLICDNMKKNIEVIVVSGGLIFGFQPSSRDFKFEKSFMDGDGVFIYENCKEAVI